MSILKISEAASLAIHAAVMMAKEPERRFHTHEIAETFSASEHHLSKVLQRLAKAGIVEGERGPAGGFMLMKSPEKITLLNIYQAIDGPIASGNCLLGKEDGQCCCIMGDMLGELHSVVFKYFNTTTLRDLAERLDVGDKKCLSEK
jgi:Rrf2 family protein